MRSLQLFAVAFLIGVAPLSPLNAQSNPQFTAAKLLLSQPSFFPTDGLFGVGDINGDGKPDVLVFPGVAPEDFTSSFLLLNNGDGTFTTTQPQFAASPVVQCLLVDVNGDGLADAVVAEFGETDKSGEPSGPFVLEVYLNNGGNAFNTSPSFTMVGDGTMSLLAADVNGDGRPDLLVTGTSTKSYLRVLLNQGHGTFTQVNKYEGYRAVYAVGALHGGHTIDLLAQGTAGLTLLKGDGTGSFVKEQTFGYNISPNATMAVGLGDFNGDGNLDFAAAAGWTVGIFVGDGHGGFTKKSTLGNSIPAPAETGPNFPVSVNVGDFNHDGTLDLAVGSSNNNVTNPVAVFLGHGDGTFSNCKLYSELGARSGVVAADFNGDGNLDLLAGGVKLLLGQKSGAFQAVATTYAPLPDSIVSADFNGDHVGDVAVVNDDPNTFCSSSCNGAVSIMAGTGKGYLGPPKKYAITLAHGTITAGDINGDGFVDLVVARNAIQGGPPGPDAGTPDTVVLLGNGDGTFQPARNHVLLGSAIDTSNSAYLIDVNGDKKLDLVGDWGVALGNGDGTFQTPIPLPSLGFITQLVVGDLNKDDKPDLVVESLTTGGKGEISILSGMGDGTFTVLSGQVMTHDIGAIGLADLNKDGNLDLIYGTNNPGAGSLNNGVAVALGKGNGSFNPPTIYSTNLFAFAIVSADFNRDGFADIAIAQNFGLMGGIELLKGSASGNFTAQKQIFLNGYTSFDSLVFPATSDGSTMMVLDINGDGAPDIISLSPQGVDRLVNTGDRH